MKLFNQQIIKNNNLKQLYQYIHQEQGISRSQLAKMSHLSKTTVSSLVDELIARNFIVDSGVGVTSNVGRKPTSLFLKSSQYFTVVFSWNEHSVHTQVVDICGNTAFKHVQELSGSTYIETSKLIFQEYILEQFPMEPLLGVIIVVPAMIDTIRQEIYTTTLNQEALSDSYSFSNLQSAFQPLPVAILNDTACTAYAEKIYARVSESDFVFINFDKGIGATLFIQDSMLGKATASYTQFGHYSVDPNGKPCSCGNHGCLETTISEDSLFEKYQALHEPSILSRYDHFGYKELGQAATYGDSVAQKIICDVVSDFSQALINLVCLVHPRLIIIGGHGKDLGPFFLENLLKSLQTKGFRRMMEDLNIQYGMLDSNACFKGAMKYFFDIHYDFTQDMRGKLFIG